MPHNKRIGLFGGTFDPIHLGHLAMAKQAVTAFDLDHIRFIPCQISPHKNHSPTPVSERLEMARLATGSEPWARVDDIEAREAGPSYSWKTAEAMRKQFPDADLYWIMGTDQWNTLPTWAKPQRLAAAVDFIVCTRGVAPMEYDDFTCHPLAIQHPASATEIRNDIAKGTTHHRWLPPNVADYIAAHGLYSTPRKH